MAVGECGCALASLVRVVLLLVGQTQTPCPLCGLRGHSASTCSQLPCAKCQRLGHSAAVRDEHLDLRLCCQTRVNPHYSDELLSLSLSLFSSNAYTYRGARAPLRSRHPLVRLRPLRSRGRRLCAPSPELPGREVRSVLPAWRPPLSADSTASGHQDLLSPLRQATSPARTPHTSCRWLLVTRKPLIRTDRWSCMCFTLSLSLSLSLCGEPADRNGRATRSRPSRSTRRTRTVEVGVETVAVASEGGGASSAAVRVTSRTTVRTRARASAGQRVLILRRGRSPRARLLALIVRVHCSSSVQLRSRRGVACIQWYVSMSQGGARA